MQFVPQIRPGKTSKMIADGKMRVSDRIAGEFQECRKANHRSCLALVIAFPVLTLGALGYNYLCAGRYESTDDASVHAASTFISSQVSGRIAEIEGRDNQHVTRSQVLFRLDDTPYRLAGRGETGRYSATR
jgi:multidrug resistance efflux pump